MIGASIDQVADRLAELLQSDVLPARARPTAERLIDRLTSPVKVVIFGDPGVGKTTLFDCFSSIQSDTSFAPNISFIDGYGELDHPQSVDLFELSDVLIWVVDEWADVALQSWQRLPFDLPHHAFLVVNMKTDRMLPGPEALNVFKRLGFAAVFALNILQEQAALAHRSHDGMATLDGSELERLMEDLHSYVDAGCQADMHGALLFLQRFGAQRLNGGTQIGHPPEAKPEAKVDRSQAVPRSIAPSVSQPGVDASALRTEPAYLYETFQRQMTSLKQIDLSSGAGQGDLIQHLLNLLDETVETDDLPPELEEPLRQTHDTITLLQLENTETSAVDACVAMLQLKRHIRSVYLS